MGRRRLFSSLVLLLLIVVVSLPTQAGIFDDILSGLLIITPYVRLGEIKTDPVNPALEYFEAEEALSFLIITGASKWQLFMSGVDFTSGAGRIPLEQMEWKIGGNNYRKMPRAEKETVILKQEKESGYFQYHSLSFRLALQGDEAPGRYNSTLTLTMVFP